MKIHNTEFCIAVSIVVVFLLGCRMHKFDRNAWNISFIESIYADRGDLAAYYPGMTEFLEKPIPDKTTAEAKLTQYINTRNITIQELTWTQVEQYGDMFYKTNVGNFKWIAVYCFIDKAEIRYFAQK